MSRLSCLFLIFWIGCLALIYEIYSMRALFMFYVENTKAASIAISAFLGGLAFSSILFGKLGNARNDKGKITLIFWMQLASVFYGYFVLKNFEIIPHSIDYILSQYESGLLHDSVRFALIWLFLFMPAFFFGGAFPLVNSIYMSQKQNASAETGTVYFWDTFGAIIGALVAGFVLLPHLGLSQTILVAVTLNVLICAYLPTWRWIILLVPVMMIVHFADMPQTNTGESRVMSIISSDGGNVKRHAEKKATYVEPQYSVDEAMDMYLVGDELFLEESPYGRVSVRRFGDLTSLYINYRMMCAEDMKLSKSEKLLGSVTVSNIDSGARVLNIGLGCGVTARALLSSPNVDFLDVAEINKSVFNANKEVLHAGKDSFLTDPRLRIHLKDGADHLRQTSTLYDAIVIDIEEATVLHSAPFFTKEYFELSKTKMKEDGVFAFWSFNVSNHPEFAKIMYNTAKAVWPHVYLRFEKSMFLMIFASSKPLEMGGVDVAEELMEKYVINQDIDLVNTIDKPVIEEYYDVNAIFQFPEQYRDPFVRYPDEN